jgi:DUF3102 family protein
LATAAAQQGAFDYGALDADTRALVQHRTGEIKGLMRRAAQDIIDIGVKLQEVKGRLGHGCFGAWLHAEFAWSEASAYNMIRAAHAFSAVRFTDLDIRPSALYALAAPSTPPGARAAAVMRAEEGEAITHSVALAIVREYRGLQLAAIAGR